MLLEGIQHLLKALRDEDDANDPEDGLFSEVDKILQSSYGFTDLVLGLQRIAGKATDPQNEAKQNPKGEAKAKQRTRECRALSLWPNNPFMVISGLRLNLWIFKPTMGPKVFNMRS